MESNQTIFRLEEVECNKTDTHAVRKFHTGTEKLSACSREAVHLDLHGNQVQHYMHFREKHKEVHTWLPCDAQVLRFSSPSNNLRSLMPQSTEAHIPYLTTKFRFSAAV